MDENNKLEKPELKESNKTDHKFVVVLVGAKSKREVPISVFEDNRAAILHANLISSFIEEGGFNIVIHEIEPVKAN